MATRWYLNSVSWAPPIEHQLLGINPWRSSMSGASWSMSLLISVYDLYHTESRSIHDILFISFYIYLYLFIYSFHFFHKRASCSPPLESFSTAGPGRVWLAGKRFRRRSCHAFDWRKMLGPRRGLKTYNYHNRHKGAGARGMKEHIISKCL